MNHEGRIYIDSDVPDERWVVKCECGWRKAGYNGSMSAMRGHGRHQGREGMEP